MRSPLVPLLVVLAGLSAPAAAQTDGRLSLERPGAAALGLRGAGEAVSGEAPASGDPSGATNPSEGLILRPLAGPLLMSTPPPPDAPACRMSCAQTYYFCLAGDASDECAQAWGQCRLGCGPGSGGPPV
ncbi:MAG: hypothetical protein Q7V15_05085 [Phenylobacterium sp.]|uniref:hypothetical protein n=1 Tax=Phenylobacterium sp. TaxID=1871053 RepID=UPI0027171A56|nr:hypothetical protein [Phenylobacterium sp.]MDO8900712.1 hypothetical protein [Phenylobacterium sp.]MDP2215292.1 hypothetical protein [Phenylobacterium sp.]